MGHVLVAFPIPRFPIATIVLRLLEHSLIFVFHFVPVRRYILHDVSYLSVSKMKFITNQVRRPSRVEVIYDAVERQPATGNG